MPKLASQPKPATGKSERGSELAGIQSLMTQALMRRLTAGENTQRAWIDGTPTAKVAETFLKPNDRLTSFERLQIYNQQYWWRLLSCFNDDFRGVRAVLGQKKFDRLAVAYLEHHGSQSWSLRDLGQFLPAFLSEHPELAAPNQALALDMARVEWARTIAFDGPTRPVIDSQKIVGVPPDRLRLGLQPYITLLELQYPIDTLIRKLRESESGSSGASNAVASAGERKTRLLRSKPSAEPIHLAVHRVDFSVYYKRLDPEAFALLNALRDGISLADACDSAFAISTKEPEENAANLREWFSHWTRFGWLTKAT